MAVEHKTTAEFAPPHWLFSFRDGGASMPGYSRSDLPSSRNGQAALFTRSGDQEPHVASLGHLTAVFDGRLYDSAELARELGVPESPDNPALLLLQCYRARGESFFARLRGTFAFVLLDAEKNVLHGVRDPMGYYPCFFARAGGGLLISTSPRDLLGHPGVSGDVNRLVLLDCFFDIWARREDTFYESVQRVPPGHALRVRGGEVSLSRYWNPLPMGNGQKLLEPGDVDRFPDLLSRSVSRCLDEGRTGIFLSGGLDSVSVAALAGRASQAAGFDPPHALSLIFPYPEYNEEKVQRSVARQLGFPQELVPLEKAAGSDGLFGEARDLSDQFSFPIQNMWLPAYSNLALLGKEHGVRTILTGGGGDEWLGVTPLLAADFIRAFRLGDLRNYWSFNRRTIPVSSIYFGWNLLWVFGLRALFREQVLRALRRSAPGVLRPVKRMWRARNKPPWMKVEPQLWREFERRLEACDTDFKPLDGPYGYYFGDILRGVDHPIVSWEMEENFENSRRLGVRLLHPYIDADLVEMLCALPPESLMIGGASKGLARELLARRFPELGFEKQKKIVVRRGLPPSVLGDVSRLRRESGQATVLPVLGLADAEKLDTYFAGILQSDSHHGTFRAWQIMTTELWLRSHL